MKKKIDLNKTLTAHNGKLIPITSDGMRQVIDDATRLRTELAATQKRAENWEIQAQQASEIVCKLSELVHKLQIERNTLHAELAEVRDACNTVVEFLESRAKSADEFVATQKQEIETAIRRNKKLPPSPSAMPVLASDMRRAAKQLRAAGRGEEKR